MTAKRKRSTDHKYTGGFGIRASSNGRELTLDPIQKLTLAVPAKQVESSMPCGFRVEWASGEHKGEPFEVLCGAGVGSPWMIFKYKGKEYVAEVGDIVGSFFDAIGER